MDPFASGGLLTSVATIDEVLREHAPALGADLVGYRHHVYRVTNLCAAMLGDRADLEKIAIAAVFHDLGIWTGKTFDYLAPSIALARQHLVARGRAGWIAEIELVISDHHKITRTPAAAPPLVESFRRADWIDVTRGLRTFGLPRSLIRSVLAGWPSAGFHWRLVQLALARARSHPLTPLPMLRL